MLGGRFQEEIERIDDGEVGDEVNGNLEYGGPPGTNAGQPVRLRVLLPIQEVLRRLYVEAGRPSACGNVVPAAAGSPGVLEIDRPVVGVTRRVMEGRSRLMSLLHSALHCQEPTEKGDDLERNRLYDVRRTDVRSHECVSFAAIPEQYLLAIARGRRAAGPGISSELDMPYADASSEFRCPVGRAAFRRRRRRVLVAGPLKFAKRSTTLAMLAFLVLESAVRPSLRDSLAYVLFPDMDEVGALEELRRYLYLAAKALPERPGEALALSSNGKPSAGNEGRRGRRRRHRVRGACRRRADPSPGDRFVCGPFARRHQHRHRTGCSPNANACVAPTVILTESIDRHRAKPASTPPRSRARSACWRPILGARTRSARCLPCGTSRAIPPARWPTTTSSPSGCATNWRSRRCPIRLCVNRFCAMKPSPARSTAPFRSATAKAVSRLCRLAVWWAAGANSRSCMTLGAGPPRAPAASFPSAGKAASAKRA